jgi:UDP-N-acetylmuramate--alanine ligase
MSALARYFRFHGKKVSGYDKTETVLTKELMKEGISVHYQDRLDLAPKDADLVVYTPAIPASHQELAFYKANGYELAKRSEVLGIITNSSFNICVAGTHGKTTISTMIAHLLRHTGYGCNAFLGGISVNYNSNYWSDKRNVCVVEADEYDRSFLRLSPDIAVISAMDPDHLDIYGTAEVMEEAFIEFSGRLKSGGKLLYRYGLKRATDLKGQTKLSYSLDNISANAYASGLQNRDGGYVFDLVVDNWQLKQVELNMGGLHNVENTVVAVAVAHALGIEDLKIKEAVAAFRGVKRRFEYLVRNKNWVFVDDYAHHPEELRALISSAKKLFPGRRCMVIFQPHLFTRTRDLAEGFAESLDLADEVVLLPIYPARELPIEGVTSNIILDKMKNKAKQILEKDELLKEVREMKEKADKPMLLITAGAGDIDQLVEPVKNILDKS